MNEYKTYNSYAVYILTHYLTLRTHTHQQFTCS